MENASKALIMAAEVLIGFLVLSLMVYLFISFGSNASEISKQLEESKLSEFNNQFDKYNGKSDVTIYDIVTLANLARENNNYYELTTSTNGNYYIIVKLNGTSIEKKTSEELTQNLKDNLKNADALKTFTCTVNYSNATGRVKVVSFN